MNKINNLTVVIVTYLTDKKILLNCIQSIDRKTKIIIVENSKNFRNRSYFLKRFSNIEIICSGLNLGYGKGNNFGLDRVKTDYALILNPDIVCKDNFFKKVNNLIKKKTNFRLLDVNTQMILHIYQQAFLIKKSIIFFKIIFIKRKKKH